MQKYRTSISYQSRTFLFDRVRHSRGRSKVRLLPEGNCVNVSRACPNVRKFQISRVASRSEKLFTATSLARDFHVSIISILDGMIDT